MARIALDADIHPASDVRTNFSSLLDQIHETRRPIVITQHGRSAAVLLDVAEYEHMMEKFEIISDIETATRQLEAGQGIPFEQAKKHLKNRLRS